MPDLDNGYARHPEFFSCQNPSVADDYLTPPVRHHGHHETKLPDGIRELIDLTLRMLPRVPRIQDEFCHRPILNLNLDQPGVGRRVRFVRHHLLTFLSELPNPRRVILAGKLSIRRPGNHEVSLTLAIKNYIVASDTYMVKNLVDLPPAAIPRSPIARFH